MKLFYTSSHISAFHLFEVFLYLKNVLLKIICYQKKELKLPETRL